MKYVAPTNSTTPDAHYVGRNPAAGIQGSQVPPAAVEHPMREIIEVIRHFGLTPDESDLTQLRQAIEAGLRSANAYTLPTATGDRLGGVKIGSNISVSSDGTISVAPPGGGGGGGGGYVLPPASITTLGGVKIGGGVIVAGDGTISATPASVGALNKAGDTATGPITAPRMYRSPGALPASPGSSLLTGQDYVQTPNEDLLQTFANRFAAGDDWQNSAWYFRRIVDGFGQGAIRFLGGQVQLGTDATFPLRVDANAYAPTQAAGDSSERLATTAFVQGAVANSLTGRKVVVAVYEGTLCIGGSSSLYESTGRTATLNVAFYTPQPDAGYEVVAMGFISGVTPSAGGRYPGPVAAQLAYKNQNGFGFSLSNWTGNPDAFVSITSAIAIRTL